MMNIETRPFGYTAAGEAVTAYTLRSGKASATILDYGATLQALCVPNNAGGVTDVLLGYDTIEDYEKNTCYFGATVGRVCNRIGGAAFTLGGRTYTLAANDGKNHLHGGKRGFDRRMWTAVETAPDKLVLARRSPDGEEGYPGNLDLTVTFALTGEPALTISYDGSCDQDTLVSLTSHGYFNLGGGGSVRNHCLSIAAERRTENNSENIPTGALLPVAGTPFDFRTAKAVGRDIAAVGGCYDHNYVLGGSPAAVLTCPETGVSMAVETTLPGLQLYTPDYSETTEGKGGAPITGPCAVCLEPQIFPDAIHHYGFPSPVLHAGEALHQEITFRFRVV